VSIGNDDGSETNYGALARALRAVFPAAEYRADLETTKAWNECFHELNRALSRDRRFDSERFTAAIKEGWLPGYSNKARRIFGLVVIIISVTAFWKYHSNSVMKARMTGRGDVWALLCEQHPKVAERLLADGDDTGILHDHCADFEHHFADAP